MKRKIIKLTIITLSLTTLIIFFLKPLNLAKINKNPTISILNDKGETIINYINNHPTTPINIDKIPSKNIDILLYIEDKTFYKHSGFNIQRIIKTIYKNIINKETHGASTITQQYVKNIYLNNSKTISRKLKEIYYSIKIEQLLSKDEILENYLNCIYFGNDIYGLHNASIYYFNKNYQQLSTKEMIALIALLNAPSYYSNNIKQWNNKKNILSKILYENQIISYQEHILTLKDINLNINKNIYSPNLLFYCDATLNEFNKLNIKSDFSQTIKIKTKYNNKLNNININTTGNIASISINKEGYILSCIGDKEYTAFNIALNGKRDIGSTIKPLLYYEALKCGFSINKTHLSSPYTFKYKDTFVTIKNYASNYSNKQINMKTALATSDNIYAIKTHLEIGTKTLVNHLKKYNITAESIPSLALGSVGMSLYELTRIYSQFFTEGNYLTLNFIESISINDKIIYKTKPSSIRLGNPKYFNQIRQIMNGLFDPTITNATAKTIGPLLKSKCYGKSGLTDYDSYMIGFNDEILIAVWSGHLNNEPLVSPNIKRLPKEIFLKQINSLY